MAAATTGIEAIEGRAVTANFLRLFTKDILGHIKAGRAKQKDAKGIETSYKLSAKGTATFTQISPLNIKTKEVVECFIKPRTKDLPQDVSAVDGTSGRESRVATGAKGCSANAHTGSIHPRASAPTDEEVADLHDADLGVRYVELVRRDRRFSYGLPFDALVGKADIFVSHAWGGPGRAGGGWLRLVEVICQYSDAEVARGRRAPFFWIDIFAINQYWGTEEATRDMPDWEHMSPEVGFQRVIRETQVDSG